MLNILIEGWIKYPHSYSIVNVYQLVALSKLPDVKLYLREIEPFRKEWPAFASLVGLMLTEEDQALLNAIEIYQEGKTLVDIIYRISFRHNIVPSQTKIPVAVFYTAEFKILEQDNIIATNGDFNTFATLVQKGRLAAITPSKWSRDAFSPKLQKKCGNFLKVIPHGVDTSKFYPDTEGRKKLRKALGIAPTDVVFLNIGAMTGNKNIVSVIKSFYEICKTNENVRLILKGINAMYGCEQLVYSYLQMLFQEGHIVKDVFDKCVGHRITYLDGSMGYSSLRELYNSADCYLCPYIAEGFNMPALEAQACGTACIVPRGGPTDDFIHPECALFLPTLEHTDEKGRHHLLTKIEDLQAGMMQFITADGLGAEIINKASKLGPSHVESKYTWDIIAKKMVKYFNSLV